MMDKLDEIANKYNLSLHGKLKFYDNIDEFMKILNLKNFIELKNEGFSGYIYEDGTFQFDLSLPFDDQSDFIYESDVYVRPYNPVDENKDEIIATYGEKYAKSKALNVWVPVNKEGTGLIYKEAFVIEKSGNKLVAVPYKGEYNLKKEHDAYMAKSLEHSKKTDSIFKGFQFSYTVKGSLDYVGLNIGNIKDYVEWEYETKSGIVVNLAQSDDHSLVMLDLDNAFVVINMLDTNSLSKKDIEKLVDKIDYKQLL